MSISALRVSRRRQVELDYAANETLVSPEISATLVATGSLQVTPPALPAGVAGMRVYIGATSGGKTLEGSTNGNATYFHLDPILLRSSKTTLLGISPVVSGRAEA